MTPASGQAGMAKVGAAKSIAALARANDNSVRFHLDGHEVDEETFLGYRPFPISQTIKASVPPLPRPTIEESVSRRVCAKIDRGYRLFAEPQSIADIDKAYRIAREVQAMFDSYEWLEVPPLYVQMLDELVDGADTFDRSQRAEIAMAKWMRVGVLVAICCLFVPILARFAPRAYRSDIVLGSLAISIVGSAFIALKGVR